MSWHQHLTIDLLARVLERSVLHPFVAWMVPLCLRAVGTPYEMRSMRIGIGYATFVTVLAVLQALNERLAYGTAREVDLSQEVVVITGGANGIGQLVAEVYGMRGASVAVLDVQDLDSEAEARGVEFYRCDVGDRKQVQAAAKRIEQDLGPCTVLINNAGIVNGKPLLELTTGQIERNFRVNLLSHFHTLQTFLPHMIEHDRGTIVTVSSVLGYLGARNLSDYTAAKAGLHALHASLRAELPPSSSIKTVLVTPGQVSTSLFAGVKTPSNFFGPLLDPVDVAREIVRAVDAGHSTVLAMPLYARWIQILHVLPASLQRFGRAFSGLDRAMDGFERGRGGQVEKKAPLQI